MPVPFNVAGRCEGLEGIATLDEPDLLFIGPYDLSQSLGFSGRSTDPPGSRPLRRRRHGTASVLGMFVDDASRGLLPRGRRVLHRDAKECGRAPQGVRQRE
jgi:hypothetical protein